MVEEIKKELLKLNIHECDIEDVFEILDKYDNQPDYKGAFDELSNSLFIDGIPIRFDEDDLIEIKEKYNLGGE